MKLKKIASLMLAGVMAISMLAGCSNNGNNNAASEVPTDTSLAAAMNAEQDEDADVVLNFTYDSSIEAMMRKALEIYGTNATAAQAEGEIINGLNANSKTVSSFDDLDPQTTAEAAKTRYYVEVYNMTRNLTDEAFYEDVAEAVDMTGLPKDYTASNVKYTYAYTAKVANIKFETSTGEVQHYAAVVVNCDTTVKAV